MGDRASLGITATYRGPKGPDRTALYVFTHWRGETVPERVRLALQRSKPRWGDPLYMTRVLYDAVVIDGWGSLDGYALGPRMWDTEPRRPVLVVDLDRRQVGVCALDRYTVLPVVTASTSWQAYLARPRVWGASLLS